jgi:urea transport system substrate-binding protein
MSADTPENEAFISAWHDFIGSTDRVTNDPMEAHYIGFNMWVNAVEPLLAPPMWTPCAKRDVGTGIPEPDRRHGCDGHQPPPVEAGLIGEIRADGQFDIISQTEEVPGAAWSPFLTGQRKSGQRLEGTGLRHV